MSLTLVLDSIHAFLEISKLPVACDCVILSETSDTALNNIGALYTESFCQDSGITCVDFIR